MKAIKNGATHVTPNNDRQKGPTDRYESYLFFGARGENIPLLTGHISQQLFFLSFLLLHISPPIVGDQFYLQGLHFPKIWEFAILLVISLRIVTTPYFQLCPKNVHLQNATPKRLGDFYFVNFREKWFTTTSSMAEPEVVQFRKVGTLYVKIWKLPCIEKVLE